MHEDDVFRVSRRPCRSAKPSGKSDPSTSFKRELILYALITVYLGWKFATGEDVVTLVERGFVKAEFLVLHVANIPFRVAETFIDYPLRELYRYVRIVCASIGLLLQFQGRIEFILDIVSLRVL